MTGGAAIDTQAVARPSTGFQWKWALLTIPIVVGVTLALMLAAVALCVLMGWRLDDPSAQLIFGTVVLLLGMLVGGVVAGWLSKGHTVLEPGVGIAAALIGFNILLGETSSILLGWIIPFAIGAGGARLGEWLQSRSTPR